MDRTSTSTVKLNFQNDCCRKNLFLILMNLLFRLILLLILLFLILMSLTIIPLIVISLCNTNRPRVSARDLTFSFALEDLNRWSAIQLKNVTVFIASREIYAKSGRKHICMIFWNSHILGLPEIWSTYLLLLISFFVPHLQQVNVVFLRCQNNTNNNNNYNNTIFAMILFSYFEGSLRLLTYWGLNLVF